MLVWHSLSIDPFHLSGMDFLFPVVQDCDFIKLFFVDLVPFSSDSPINVMFLTPGVTPWKTTLPGVVDGANNPGIRVFEYDTQTLLVKVESSLLFICSARISKPSNSCY